MHVGSYHRQYTAGCFSAIKYTERLEPSGTYFRDLQSLNFDLFDCIRVANSSFLTFLYKAKSELSIAALPFEVMSQ